MLHLGKVYGLVTVFGGNGGYEYGVYGDLRSVLNHGEARVLTMMALGYLVANPRRVF